MSADVLPVPERDGGFPDLEGLSQLVRVQEPDWVARSREDLIGQASQFKAMRDVERYREWLRAARLWEWEMARRWPANPDGAHRADERPPLSADNGADRGQWQRVYAVGRAPREYILEAADIGDLVQRAFRTKEAHVGANSGVPEWYTPAELVDAARDVLGVIDLDPASSPIANDTVKATRYFTIDDDGLARPWRGRVWMNPPYSAGVVDRFVAKLLDEHHAGNVPAAVVLTNNSTDTRWWQSLARRSGAVCLLAGRVRFYGPEGEKGAPLQGQTVCYLGDNTSLFTERFDEFGVVL